MSERMSDIDARINASIGPVAKALKGLGDGFDAFTTRANEKLDGFIDRLENLKAALPSRTKRWAARRRNRASM